MINNSDLIEEEVSVSDDDLPLNIVNHRERISTKKLNPRASWFLRLLIFVAIIVCSMYLGGVIGVSSGIKEDIAISVSNTIGKTQKTSIVMALGHLLPISDVVKVGVPSSVQNARIYSLKVVEGSRVKKGEILAVLDNESRLQAGNKIEKILISVQEATLEQIRSSLHAGFLEAMAELERIKETTNLARLDFKRSKTLFDKKSTSRANFERAQSIYREMQKESKKALATLTRYPSKNIDNHPDVILAKLNIQKAKAEYRHAEQELESAYVRAPIDGTVLEIHAKEGEKSNIMGVLDLGNIAQMTAKIEIYETYINDVKERQDVIIESKAFSNKLHGKVSHIGLKIKKQSVISSNPAANTDARVIEVIVLLDKNSSKVASRFTNLQIEAKINIENK